MNDNELLIEKVKTQIILDDVAEHDLAKYVSDTHARPELRQWQPAHQPRGQQVVCSCRAGFLTMYLFNN